MSDGGRRRRRRRAAAARRGGGLRTRGSRGRACSREGGGRGGGRKRREQRRHSRQLQQEELKKATEAAARAKEAEAERAVKSRGRLAWLETRDLDSVRPIEFEHADSALSADARAGLERVAAALKADPELKLHIAGHSQSSEDARVSSQRAQAVGAALISMGAAPARLRAKGYGATVSLPATQRAKLKLRSERRTGLHPIGEVRTRYGLEFDAGAAALDADARKLLADVAALCKEKPRLRLSVEGHADARGARQRARRRRARPPAAST